MQINSTSNISDQYLSALQSKQKETATKNFEEELLNENKTDTVETAPQTQKIEEPQERFHEVLTYKNTKGMSDKEVDEYFSEKTEEERNKIKALITISNNFSDDDIANEAVFNEYKRHDIGSGNTLLSTNLFTEKSNFALGMPSLNNVIRVSDAYVAAKQAGIENPHAQGIFMNAADKTRYESGNYMISDVQFTSEEANDFLSTMLNLAQQRMDEARGTAVYDDYKDAFERYQRLNDNYNSLLAKQEASNKLDINV